MVDILMATYNSEKYVKEQIESILNQTVANWKLYIRDDCSTDKTFEIVKQYEKRYPERITVQQSDENGKRADRNFFKLIENVRYGYILFCDQDDVWCTNKIEKMQKRMIELESKYGNVPLLLHSDAKVVDQDLNLINKSFFNFQQLDRGVNKLNKIVAQGTVTGCMMMVNKTLLDMIKIVPNKDIMHDWWFSLIASAFGKIEFIDEPLVEYRQHMDNSVGAKNTKNLFYNIKRAFDVRGSRKMLEDTYIQAQEFLDIYYDLLSGEQIKILKKYTEIPKMSKIQKITTLFKYDFLKVGIQRVIGQIVYI